MAKRKILYKDAISEMEIIIEKIENNELDVDELAENIQRVSFLIETCKAKLYTTETEVEKILKKMSE
ncbi:MAG: exodeoxyribonuclease VII small subunit [Bacteroidetes bacterium]|jgi:exodeoxyribonuclease VII small subunit|nr:exodeoxyribonuclease VII small subunit [Bacteroidota bacterium]MBT6686849.1 exodeoxyribonuclease VII small subunit [Bacteroidota bacterium]MBT7144178.1 exodeoxyribonuclease VII small subunit [Bacteroidota bacterium]MBT7491897.1 exodeoxyribonuclease VII small subunit [Bacteroidota bacterium]